MMTVSVRLALFGARLFERGRAVGDGFDTGHGGTAVGEGLHQQPDEHQRAQRFAGADGWRRHGDGDGVSAGGDDVIDANTDGDEQCGDEEGKVGSIKICAGLLDAARVHDGDDGEDDEAHQELMVVEIGRLIDEGADQGGDAGGDADRGGEDVVDHQRSRGKQAGARAQVFAGNGVGTATVEVGLDGLPVAEVKNHQQREDRREDRQQIMLDTDETERNKQRHGGFRAVCGAGKAVEPEDRDAGGYSNMGFVLGVRCERLSDYKINKCHGNHKS